MFPVGGDGGGSTRPFPSCFLKPFCVSSVPTGKKRLLNAGGPRRPYPWKKCHACPLLAIMQKAPKTKLENRRGGAGSTAPQEDVPTAQRGDLAPAAPARNLQVEMGPGFGATTGDSLVADIGEPSAGTRLKPNFSCPRWTVELSCLLSPHTAVSGQQSPYCACSPSSPGCHGELCALTCFSIILKM